MPPNTTLILIPTYNECSNVLLLASALLELDLEADILFVDDGSPDGTGEILDQLSEQQDRVEVMHRKQKSGLGSAYKAGFTQSINKGYVVTVCMDADFSHDPADLPRFIHLLKEKDMVGGSRYMKDGGIINWPLPRLLLSRTAAGYARLLTRMPFTDPTGGYNGYRNDMLAKLPLSDVSSRGYSFQIEMKHLAWKKGFRVWEIPILFTERREGKSKMSAGIVREALWIVWKLVLKR